jgi:CRISPR-associated exonuclease Cas4
MHRPPSCSQPSKRGSLNPFSPSDGSDDDPVQFETRGPIGELLPIDAIAVIAGGSLRGIVLHMLMEELLTGELDDTMEGDQQRAAILIGQLAPVGRPSLRLTHKK